MRLTRSSAAIDPSELRLPIVALLDVILFMLMYFMFSGTLDAEERLLSATLAVERSRPRSGDSIAPEVIDIGVFDGHEGFRVGDRVFSDRAGLASYLAQVPRDAAIVIRVSDDATVGFMAAATQLCHDAGFASVSHVPKRPTDTNASDSAVPSNPSQ